MRIYDIYDDEYGESVGILLYYEKSRTYVIEMVDTLDEWTAPLLLTVFVKQGIYTATREASLMWVRERVIPPGRQNISAILSNHNLKEYDEMKLLELSEGRCSQDRMHIEKIDVLPEYVIERQKRNLSEAVMLAYNRAMCFFNDGKVKVIELEKLSNVEGVDKVIRNKMLYSSGKISPGGYALTFNDSIDIPAFALYDSGIEIPLSQQDFLTYIDFNVIDTAGTCKMLECTRQNLSYLAGKDKIKAVKGDVKGKLYLKGNILKNMW